MERKASEYSSNCKVQYKMMTLTYCKTLITFIIYFMFFSVQLLNQWQKPKKKTREASVFIYFFIFNEECTFVLGKNFYVLS